MFLQISIRLCLVGCKIFSSVWLHSKKCFGKYFLVFGCIFENNRENTFSTWCSHFLNFQTKPNQKKIINGAIWVKENPFVRVVGLTNGFVEVVGSSARCDLVRSARCEWVRRQSGASGFENDGETISPVVRQSLYSFFFLSLSLSLRVVRKWRDDLDDRWLGSTRMGLNDQSDAIVLLRCDLVVFLLRQGDLLAFSLSLSSIFQGRKLFEVKMKTEIIFHRFGYILRSTRKWFSVWPNLK